MIEKFRQIVDNTKGNLEQKLELVELYKFYNFYSDTLYSFSINYLKDSLSERIFDLIKSDLETNISLPVINKIRKHFIIEIFYNELIENEYFLIIDKIVSHFKKDFIFFKSFDDTESWSKAISYIKDLIVIDNEKAINFEILNILNKSEIDLVKSVNYFKKLGYTLKLEFSEFQLNEIDFKAICQDIESEIEQINGLNVINQLLSDLKQIPKINYFINIPVVGRIDSETEPRIPIGFLLNLSVKHINNNNFNKLKFIEIITKSINLIKIFDIQPYNRFEDLVISPTEVITFIKRVATFDTIFKFNQFISKYTTNLIAGLFSWIDDNIVFNTLGFSLNDYLIVVEKILKLSDSKIQNFSISDIANDCIEFQKANLILDWSSNLYSDVNINYKLPLDFTEINFYEKPLIKLVDNSYCLLNKSICGESFITNFALNIHSKVDSFWFKLGEYTETFIKKELNKKYISYLSGKYNNFNKTNGDCDVILQNADTIIFIEFKIKALTKEAKSIDEHKLTLDVINSLLYEHWQTGKHTLLLNKYGHILFTENNKLEKNNRKIERISITFSDYGSFQHKEIILNILKAFLHISLKSDIKTVSADLKKVEKYISGIRNSYNELISIEPDKYRFPFFDCDFINLTSFLVLIEESADENELIHNLLKTKYISFGTRDFLVEQYLYNDMINKNA